jgi:hypothetical protein
MSYDHDSAIRVRNLFCDRNTGGGRPSSRPTAITSNAASQVFPRPVATATRAFE